MNEIFFGSIKNIADATKNLNAYLAIAFKSISIKERPLTAREILNVAYDYGFFPDHLFGKTPEKTLNARLSEYIRKEGEKSLFFRTAPGTYYLSAAAEVDPYQAYEVFHGNQRSKAVSQERVLVADRTVLTGLCRGPFTTFQATPFRAFFDKHCTFVNRQKAELDKTVKQFVSFTLITHRRKLLIFRRGAYGTASDELKGAISVGFGGHVNDADFDLFTEYEDGFLKNSSRELMEELYLKSEYCSIDEISDRSQVLGFINVDDSADAQQHVAVLVSLSHVSATLPSKGELSINGLRWLNLDAPVNDLSDFDLWSGMIIQNIQNGTIPID